MNLHEFAIKITLAEGKKLNLSIGQVKEVLKLVLLGLKPMSLEEISNLLKRVK